MFCGKPYTIFTISWMANALVKNDGYWFSGLKRWLTTRKVCEIYYQKKGREDVQDT